jgi:hypothetical protein
VPVSSSRLPLGGLRGPAVIAGDGLFVTLPRAMSAATALAAALGAGPAPPAPAAPQALPLLQQLAQGLGPASQALLPAPILPFGQATLHYAGCGCPPGWRAAGARPADAVDALAARAAAAVRAGLLTPSRRLRVAYVLPHHNVTGAGRGARAGRRQRRARRGSRPLPGRRPPKCTSQALVWFN